VSKPLRVVAWLLLMGVATVLVLMALAACEGSLLTYE
jgi:hypothetical protein